MRKRQISPIPPSVVPSDQAWLDVDRTAFVEVTSEENGYPIESALLLGLDDQGWRAANSGTQTIRLIFDEPQKFRRIRLVFEESQNTRTQEFVLRWSPDAGHSFREVVRQQWNFSPPGSTRETEDYAVELSDVTVLELIIVPDQSGGAARASLASLRLA
jgi:F5/8 type C domain